MQARRLTYVVTEAWFFLSHFAPMARAARDSGLKVSVAGRVGDRLHDLQQEGFEVVDTVEARDGGLLSVGRHVLGLIRMMRSQRPDCIHLIGLRMILLGGFARLFAPRPHAVFAVTGLGFLMARPGWAWRRALVFRACRWLGASRKVWFLFENQVDAHTIGLSARQLQRTRIVGGAGVDPLALSPEPLPPAAPLRLAMMARMIYSKGADLAVAAVTQARAAGVDVTLDLYGQPDPGNPASLDHATLVAWSGMEGVTWRGWTSDVAAVWRDSHLCILPSRGGEGLPRTLLEAAACGRGIITTDVPGCAEFVRDGVEGRIAPRESIEALIEAISFYADRPAAVAEAGLRARARVLDGHTEADVAQTLIALYRDMLDGSTPRN